MNDRLGVVGAVLLGLGAVLQLIPQISGRDAVLGWPGGLVLISGGACFVLAQHRAAARRGKFHHSGPAGAGGPASGYA
jgi:hypothetical protein